MFNFRVYNKQFLGLDGTKLVAVAKVPNTSEEFEIVRASHDKYRIRIKASNGFYLQVRTEKSVAADGRGGSGWRDDDPSVFEMVIVLAKTKTAHTMNCEFQITNGYGPDKAPHVMREHWRTFVTKKDFKFLPENGLNAVRIPVGWWIASDPSPPWPYVGGSLNALDNAFPWAEKYNIKIILDLHAAPGSQNGFCHGSSRDGLDQEWGQTDQSIDQTIAVIEFLTSRYANRTSLYAIELLNETLAPIATFEIVTKYYKAGYEAVRKYSSTAYVLFSARLIPSRDYDIDRGELFPLASRLPGSVIDIHLYNLFNDYFKNLTVQQNLDYILINTSALLNNFTTFSGVNGPPVFVGEWVDEWETMNATEADYKRYAQVQKEVYGKATFGWCYWTLKQAISHWSFEWMVRNGYLKLT